MAHDRATKTRAAENLRDAFERCILVGLTPQAVLIRNNGSYVGTVGVILEDPAPVEPARCHTSVAVIPLDEPIS